MKKMDERRDYFITGTFYIEDVTVASNIPSKYMTHKKKPGEFHENYRIAILSK